LHPCADQGNALAAEEEAVISVLERTQNQTKACGFAG